MAKIYPDTDRFVDFYQAALQTIDIFDELQKHKISLVLTEQTVTEFRRNRVSTLKWLVTQFKKSIDIGSPYTTSILRALPGHKELIELLDRYKKKGNEVLEQLKHMIVDEKQDPIAQRFLALAADPAVTNLKLTNQAIERAHRRKLLGNPPCSPDKYSIGDEVNWELLIENMKDELIVVTKDHTFHENLSLLSEEYHHQTGRTLLLVTEKFSDALTRIGQSPTRELIEAEKKEQELPPLGWLDVDSYDAPNVMIRQANRRQNALYSSTGSQSSDDGWLAATSAPSPSASSSKSARSPSSSPSASPSPAPSTSSSAVPRMREDQA
jgi:hypothetical protein